MPWQDRTRRAAYTSPSGRRFEFEFENVNRAFDKNTSAFNFPGIDGTYIQDLGASGKRYPMRVIFWGDNHDLIARQFENALLERGRGKLDHPRAGRVDVIPFGTITVREDLVRTANQTIFEVEFWAARSVLFPSGAKDPAAGALSAANNAFLQAASIFAASVDVDLQSDIVDLRNRVGLGVDIIDVVFTPLVAQDSTLLRQFKAVGSSITQNLDTLGSDPLTVANQVATFLRIPAKVSGSTANVLNAYNTAIGTVTGGTNPVRPTNNQFRSDELFSVGAVGGAIEAAVTGDFRTRGQAVSAAGAINDQFDTVNTFREANYA